MSQLQALAVCHRLSPPIVGKSTHRVVDIGLEILAVTILVIAAGPWLARAADLIFAFPARLAGRTLVRPPLAVGILPLDLILALPACLAGKTIVRPMAGTTVVRTLPLASLAVSFAP